MRAAFALSAQVALASPCGSPCVYRAKPKGEDWRFKARLSPSWFHNSKPFSNIFLTLLLKNECFAISAVFLVKVKKPRYYKGFLGKNW